MNMMNNKNFYYYFPIVISIALIIGLLIGKMYFSESYNIKDTDFIVSALLNNNKDNKLEALIKYIENEYVDSVNKDSIIEKAIESLLEKLDPHSVYIPARDFNEMNEPLEGEFDGIGIEFSIQNDTIVIMNTIIGGPSEKLGLMAGDRIIKVNDSLVAGINITNQKVMKLLKGPKGTKVKIHVKRQFFSNLLEFDIIRDKIPMHSIDAVIKVNENIGYIKISRFAKTTPDEFVKALKKLHNENIHNIIIDLRGNGGGYMDAAIEVADEFLKEGELIVYTEGKSHPKTEYFATKKGLAHNDKIVILQDIWSASASEILAGAIQDNDRGVIIGQRSFGKGLVQEPIFFNDNSSVRLTVARYFTPSGRCIQRNYNNSLINYYTNIFIRNDSLDSIDVKNAPKYKTKKGRTVYGNGGILPDITIKENESKNDFFYKTASQSLIYQFAFQYSDKNRQFFKKFKNWKELDNFIKNSNIYDEFVAYAEKKGIKTNYKDIINSKNLIMNHLRSYIVRNIFNNEGFYLISFENDPYFQKAIQYFNNSKNISN
jgi:carboxyl-terminal processing protease